MRCPACQNDNEDRARFCTECGVALKAVCPACGAASGGGRFCAECGAPLRDGTAAATVVEAPPQPGGPIAERRVCSVLFGDLVGFTPLAESRDAEEVRELLSGYFEECRTVIGRYGGVVEKFIGDAVMAVWGVPVAHEDDAERAVRAGLELVATVAALGEDVGAPGLAMRVGLVTGEVAVTLGATTEGMVAGDAVNTASRVQALAEPSRVWVDDTTRELAAAAITFDDAGEHALKGKAEPIRLWRAGAVVGELGGGQRVDGLEAPLAGRDSDLRLVKELFHATEDTGRPRLVVLDGEAGIGKSRLAWEFFKYIDGLATLTAWHRGRCLSYGDGVAFWALAEAFRARFGLVEADAGAVVDERLDSALGTFVPDPVEREWLRPRLAVLLGAGAGAAFAREDLFAAWTVFLERVGQGDPVVLVLEDAQHADDGLLDFLDHLLASARAPVFVLALARPELLIRRPELGGRRASVVRVEPLGEQAMADLVDGLVVGLPATIRTALVERAEGIPLFAVETVRALIDKDLVIPREGRYVPADGVSLDLDAIGAPASLQALVAARLDALPAEDRRVVADASVLGTSFTRDSLVALGADPESLDAILASLTRREIIALQADRFTAERGQFRFVQSAIRQVAYGTQSRRDRKSRHLAAADHLAAQPDPGDDLAVVIAQHLLDAVDASVGTDPEVPELTARALGYLERAAARARAVGAPGDAQRLSEAALARTDDPADRARLHLAAARAASDSGHVVEARQHADAATELFDSLADPISAGLAAAESADARISSGDSSGAIDAAEPRCQDLAGVEGAEWALLGLTRALVSANTAIGAWDGQAQYAERALLFAEAVDDADGLAFAHTCMGNRYLTIGAPTTARASYQTAASIARDHDLPLPLSRALTNLAAMLHSWDLSAAMGFAAEAMEVSRRCGVRRHQDGANSNYLLGLWVSGRWAEARTALSGALDGATDATCRQVMVTIEGWLADADGTAIPDHSSDRNDSDDELMLAWRYGAAIAAALANGDAASAAGIAAVAIDHLLAAAGIDDDFFLLWPPMVQAALANHDVPFAERLLEPVTTAQRGRLSPAVSAQWHRLRGLVAAARGDDPKEVESDLRAGIKALDAFGAVGYRARAQEELARWLTDQNRPDEAEPLFDAARVTYADIGAAGWLARLEASRTAVQA